MPAVPKRPREPFTPVPAGMQQMVLVDTYYKYDVVEEWEGQATLKDYCVCVWGFSPDLGKTTYNKKEVNFWVTQRYTIWCDREMPVTDDYGKLIGTQPISSEAYAAMVLKDASKAIPPKVDENGEPFFRIGKRSKMYQHFEQWGGEAFVEAYEKGVFSPERLVQRKAQFTGNIQHSKPDKNGQVWPRVMGLGPGLKDQNIEPDPDYVRIKDRPPEPGEDKADEKDDGEIPF